MILIFTILKLTSPEYKKIKKDPYATSTDKVLAWKCQKWIAASGNETLRVDYTSEYRTFSVWYMPKKRKQWESLCMAVYGRIAPDIDLFVSALAGHGKMPTTLTVRKDDKTGFYTVYSHNEAKDEIPRLD